MVSPMVAVRRLEPGELDVLRSVRLAALADSPDAFNRTLAEERDLDDERWGWWFANGAVFVAGEAAGMAAGIPDQSDRSIVWLVAMWVAPDHRRRGVGTALVDGVVSWAAESGASTVRLMVVDGNERVQRLYERCGFSGTGHTVERERDGANELVLQRPVALRRTDRSTVRRMRERGRYDRAVVDAILDEGLICHVGLLVDGRPAVLPTAYARVGDHLYVHGAAGNHMLRTLAAGGDASVTVTLVDGLVLARSAFHHSINYRSVVLFGEGVPVTDADEKRAALDAIVEHLVPGRTADARGASDQEVRATLVVRFPIDEGSAKVRTGGPIDDEEDLGLPVWAGVVPLELRAGPPVGDNDEPVPLYAAAYSRTRAPSSGKTFDTFPRR